MMTFVIIVNSIYIHSDEEIETISLVKIFSRFDKWHAIWFYDIVNDISKHLRWFYSFFQWSFNNEKSFVSALLLQLKNNKTYRKLPENYSWFIISSFCSTINLFLRFADNITSLIFTKFTANLSFTLLSLNFYSILIQNLNHFVDNIWKTFFSDLEYFHLQKDSLVIWTELSLPQILLLVVELFQFVCW